MTNGATPPAYGPATAALPAAPSDTLPVDAGLAELLPSGLVRGTTTVVSGSTSLLLAMVSQASAAGSWVAVVGFPSIGVLAAHQIGVVLDRVVLVPEAGPDAPQVLAALIDGMDAVLAGDVALGEGDRRRLSARARERGVVLLSTMPWPGAQTVVTAQRSHWSGVGRGEGRLRDRVLMVNRSGRGSAARGWRGQVRFDDIGLVSGLEGRMVSSLDPDSDIVGIDGTPTGSGRRAG